MRNYRLVLLLKNNLKKDQKEKLIGEVKKWTGGQKDILLDELGEKKLAYQIKHEKSADYVKLSFQADKVAADLDKRLIMQENVIRHLLVRD